MADEIAPGRSKLTAASDAASSFVALLAPEDQAALVWFNDSAAVEQPLTSDKSALIAALARVEVHPFTRIHLGLDMARGELSGPRHVPAHRPVAILLTDGRANPDGPQVALDAASRAKAEGITLFTIGLGDRDDLDDEALTAMASRPEYSFRTVDPERLAEIYAQIAGAIPCPASAYWPVRR
jgi:Mg-chelatase subunit ChlD